MKKFFTLLLTVIIVSHASGSVLRADSIPTLSKQDYLRKSKRQMAGAIVSVSGGVLLSGIGAAFMLAGAAVATTEVIISPITGTGPSEETNRTFNTGTALFLLGAAGVIVCIPLFIASAKNKKRAAALSVGTQSVQQMGKYSIAQNSLPSLRLTIRL
jgi:hypothetical protein